MTARVWDDASGAPNWQAEPAPRRRSSARDVLDAERERFFLWAPVCFAFGIAAYFALPREPELWHAGLPLFLALLVRILVARGSLASAIVVAFVLAACGFLTAKARVEMVRAPVLEKSLRNVEVSGTITRIEPKAPRGARVTVRVSSLGVLPPEKIPRFVRVRVLRKDFAAVPGDRIRVTAALAPPAKPPLPGGFDFARSAWFDQIGGVGYSFSAPDITPNSEALPWDAALAQGIEALRLAIDQRVKAALPGERGAIASALISGERGDITAETNDTYRNAGLFHILSISGLHMVVMAGAVFYMLRMIMAAIPALALRYPIKKWAAAAGIVAAFLYLAISGAAFATIRSALMITVIFGAVLLDRPALALRNVALSAFLILALFPESLFDAGFQMSFAAVTGLVATYEAVRKRMARRGEPHPVLRVVLFFGGIVFSTLIASAAVAPFAAYHFHKSQQYAVLANLFAIPVCNLLVMPAALAALVLMPFSLESLALWPMGLGIDAMTWCAAWVAKLPGAVGHVPSIPTLSFALMVMGGLWLALWQTRLRLLGISAVLAGLLVAPWMPRPDVLIARNGELVAVRGEGGLLSVLPARQAKFEIAKWLESDGDGRTAKEASDGRAFRCDGVGCTARVKALTISVARHPAAIADDCAKSDIVILNVPRPKEGCADHTALVDVFDIWRNGTYALYVTPSDEDGGIPAVRIDTVAAHRGTRPWSMPPAERKRDRPRIRDDDGASADAERGTLPKFAARPEFLAPAFPRPEIEDDNGEGAGDEAANEEQP